MSSANIWWLLDETSDQFVYVLLIITDLWDLILFKKRIKSYFSEMSILDYFYSRINPAFKEYISINQSVPINIGISQIMFTSLNWGTWKFVFRILEMPVAMMLLNTSDAPKTFSPRIFSAPSGKFLTFYMYCFVCLWEHGLSMMRKGIFHLESTVILPI